MAATAPAEAVLFEALPLPCGDLLVIAHHDDGTQTLKTGYCCAPDDDYILEESSGGFVLRDRADGRRRRFASREEAAVTVCALFLDDSAPCEGGGSDEVATRTHCRCLAAQVGADMILALKAARILKEQA